MRRILLGQRFATSAAISIKMALPKQNLFEEYFAIFPCKASRNMPWVSMPAAAAGGGPHRCCVKDALIKLAQVTAMVLAIVLALSVLVQAYPAGAAAAVDADFWAAHKTWIAIFQWLSVPLAIATFFGKHDTLTRLLSIVPIIVIAIQYSSIHLGT